MAKPYPDPLNISSVNPLDFRWEDGKWIIDPGWWRNLSSQSKDQNQTPARTTNRHGTPGRKKTRRTGK